MVVDSNDLTRWEASNSTAGSWLQLTAAKPFMLRAVSLHEYGNRIRGYRLEYLSGSVWVPFATGNSLGTVWANKAPPVVTTAVRLITTAPSAGQPSIVDFNVFGDLIP
jgi:hypothetical protein